MAAPSSTLVPAPTPLGAGQVLLPLRSEARPTRLCPLHGLARRGWSFTCSSSGGFPHCRCSPPVPVLFSEPPLLAADPLLSDFRGGLPAPRRPFPSGRAVLGFPVGPSVSARLCSALLCCLGWIAALRGPVVAGPCVLALPVSALAAAFTSEAFLTALVLLGCPPREAHWKARGQLPMPGTRCRLHRGAETQPPCPSRPWLPAPPSGSAAGLAVGGEGGAAPQLCRAWEEVPSSVVWQAEWGGRGVSFCASTPAWAGPLGGLHLPALRVPVSSLCGQRRHHSRFGFLPHPCSREFPPSRSLYCCSVGAFQKE